jgi:hypothetical protein
MRAKRGALHGAIVLLMCGALGALASSAAAAGNLVTNGSFAAEAGHFDDPSQSGTSTTGVVGEIRGSRGVDSTCATSWERFGGAVSWVGRSSRPE